MTEIPSVVIVGPHLYEVSYFDLKLNDNGGETWGVHDYPSLQILIGRYFDETQRWEIFFHEALHAMLENVGFRAENDEEFVTALAPVLTRFLLDNEFLSVDSPSDEQIAIRQNARQERITALIAAGDLPKGALTLA